MNLYTDHDADCCDWLRALVNAGLLPPADVWQRGIEELTDDELRPYTQVHLFAGIGGWPYALQLAGWPTDRPVWTGSCPCQPFSAAGQRRGHADARHLWPEMRRLVAECRPATVFGEQVASALGREWLAGVRADLEAMDYAVGAADLCAASVGAPHIRQRLFWVAESGCVADERSRGRGAPHGAAAAAEGEAPQRQWGWASAGDCGGARRLVHPDGAGRTQQPGRRGEPARPAAPGWNNYIIIPCGDGKARRIEPGLEPLAHGLPGRVAQLRGLGNAIVPQVAAAFVTAYMETGEHGETDERARTGEEGGCA